MNFLLILEAIFRRRAVFHFGQILQLLELLELLVVAYVRVVSGETHQVMHKAENDEEAGEGRENEHHFRFLHRVFAERLHLELVAHSHVFFASLARKQEV